MQISGFGKAKADKYGDDILSAVESYCQQYGIETNMAEKQSILKKSQSKKSTAPKVDTKLVSFELYKTGKTVQEISAARNLVKSTIEAHLAHYIAEGEISIDELVNKQKQQLIKDAVAIHGSKP